MDSWSERVVGPHVQRCSRIVMAAAATRSFPHSRRLRTKRNVRQVQSPRAILSPRGKRFVRAFRSALRRCKALVASTPSTCSRSNPARFVRQKVANSACVRYSDLRGLPPHSPGARHCRAAVAFCDAGMPELAFQRAEPGAGKHVETDAFGATALPLRLDGVGADVRWTRELIDRLRVRGIVQWSPFLPRAELRKTLRPRMLSHCSVSATGLSWRWAGGTRLGCHGRGCSLDDPQRGPRSVAVHETAPPLLNANCQAEDIYLR